MIRKIKIDHVDRTDPRLLQGHMIVREGAVGADARLESARIPEPVRGLPDALHHFGRIGERVAFLLNTEILVPDHVEQDRIERRVPGRLMFGEVPRADERLRGIVEIAVVFSVDEQQIHADRGRRGFEDVRETEQDRHA